MLGCLIFSVERTDSPNYLLFSPVCFIFLIYVTIAWQIENAYNTSLNQNSDMNKPTKYDKLKRQLIKSANTIIWFYS